MNNKVFIVGVGMVKVDRYFWDGLGELFVKSAFKAIEDANNAEIEALIVSNMTSSSLSEQDNLGSLIADYMGFKGLPSFNS